MELHIDYKERAGIKISSLDIKTGNQIGGIIISSNYNSQSHIIGKTKNSTGRLARKCILHLWFGVQVYTNRQHLLIQSPCLTLFFTLEKSSLAFNLEKLCNK